MKSLAELQQRKLEVISQLEKVVGKTAASVISNSASTQAKQDTAPISGLEGTPPYYFCMAPMNTGPTFVRSDSILKAEDDYIPFDTPCVSKYGPISRMPKDNLGNNQTVQVSSSFGDNTISTPMVRRPVSAPSPVPSWYVATNSPNLQAALSSGHTIISPPAVKVKDGFIFHGAIDSTPQWHIQRMQENTSRILIDESNKVKLQLRTLEKRINDLKIASLSLSEREILSQELQLIEQGILEKQKEVKLVSLLFSVIKMNSGI